MLVSSFLRSFTRRPPPFPLFPTRRSSDLSQFALLRHESRTRAAVGAAYAAKANIAAAASALQALLLTVSIFSLFGRSEEHTSELQSLRHLVCRLLLAKKNKIQYAVKNKNE